MTRSHRSVCVLLAATFGCLALVYYGSLLVPQPTQRGEESASLLVASSAVPGTDALRLPAVFEPNQGQWKHSAKFVHRSGPMTLFLEDRGWVIDLVEPPSPSNTRKEVRHSSRHEKRTDDAHETRAAALRMTFEGDRHIPEVIGETKLPGHHNYFLGSDETRWRTGVPLYASVRYDNLYPGIDLRLREANGVPEYDLLLEPGADLSSVIVHVEGAQGLSHGDDGSLIIETALGPVTQSIPKTWQVDRSGEKRDVACRFTVLDERRFGFAAPEWNGETNLTIDPALIWSTLLGGRGEDSGAQDLSVDDRGVVTVAGRTGSIHYPTTIGAYDTTYTGGGYDAFVSRLDPSQAGAAQLVYSTVLGGDRKDAAFALSVAANGVVTVAGWTESATFPTTNSAYDTTHNSGGVLRSPDAFISRLDPGRTGTAQLTYSTFLGGNQYDSARALAVDDQGVVIVAGGTGSTNFPTTSGAYDTTFNGGSRYPSDVFVSRLDPRKAGTAQLDYSTFLGGRQGVLGDFATALSVDARGIVTVVGLTSSTDFPTTNGAYDTAYNGGNDAFVSQLLPVNIGPASLLYSTFLGGSGYDYALALSVEINGVIVVAGHTNLTDFPTTSNAYDTTSNGSSEAFVSRLDTTKTGTAQLIYSTFLGGSRFDTACAVSTDNRGFVTVTGWTTSPDFPTTRGAYDSTYNGSFHEYDAFISRLDPSKIGPAQLAYSTFLATTVSATIGVDRSQALFVDASGVVTLSGTAGGTNFPTTRGAYDSTYNGNGDVFVSRLSMGAAFYADRYELPSNQAGVQKLWLDAGPAHANLSYAIFGSMTGTSPGITLTGIHVPLNVDPYTDFTIGSAGPPIFVRFRGVLDRNGEATASFNLPFPPTLPSFTLHHAFVVFDNTGKYYMASNAVPLTLK